MVLSIPLASIVPGFYLLYIAFTNTDVQLLFIICSFQNMALDYRPLSWPRSQLGTRFYKITYSFLLYHNAVPQRSYIFMCKTKLSHLAVVDSRFCQSEFVSDGLTCGAEFPAASCFIPFPNNSPLHENLEPLRACFRSVILMRLIIIFRVMYVKIPILLFAHGIYRFECTSLCQQVAHIILHRHITRSICEKCDGRIRYLIISTYQIYDEKYLWEICNQF